MLQEFPAELREYVEVLKQNPEICGVILFGSWARGNNRLDSDFDLILVTRGETKRGIEKRGRSNFELVLTTEIAAQEFWTANRDDCADLWGHAKVLFDRDETVKRLQLFAQELVAQGKPVIPETQVQHLRFDCEDLIRAAEQISRDDPVTAKVLLHAKIFNLTELYFHLRREWLPAPKLRLNLLKVKNPKLYAAIQSLYSSTNPSVSALVETAKKLLVEVFGG